VPSVSKKQHNLMALVANNPAAAKRVGIPQSVGKEFMKADKGKRFGSGSRADLQAINKPKTDQGKQELFSKGGEMKKSTPMAAKRSAPKKAAPKKAAPKTAMKKGSDDEMMEGYRIGGRLRAPPTSMGPRNHPILSRFPQFSFNQRPVRTRIPGIGRATGGAVAAKKGGKK